MRSLQIGAAFGFVAAFWMPSIGLAQDPHTLIGDSVEQVVTDQFYVGRGYSTYKGNFRTFPKCGTEAVASLPEIFVGPRHTGRAWDLHGQAVMTFDSYNSGTLLFNQTVFIGNSSQYLIEVVRPHVGNWSKYLCGVWRHLSTQSTSCVGADA